MADQVQADPSTVAGPAGSLTTNIPLGNLPFASPWYSIGREICQNMYLENAQSQHGKSSYYLLKIPGLKRFGALETNNLGGCRGIFTSTNGRSYIVNGNTLSELLEDGSKLYIGSLSTYYGQVSMAENGSLLMIVDGTNGYILRYSDNNFTYITDEYFPGNASGSIAATHVTFLDTYFICNIPNTNQYFYSTSYYVNESNDTAIPYDPAIPDGYWNPLNSGAKIGKTDNITVLINCNGFLWLFGSNSCEVHYDTGNYNGQLFARYQGAVLNIGCNAPNSVAVYANNVFWLGTDIVGTLGVYTNDGMAPLRISTRGIEQIITEMSDYTDCKAYTYAQAGHSFYVMYFPTANKTFTYDTVTQSWHERTKLIKSTALLARWDGLYATSNWDTLIIGDVTTSAVYALDTSYYLNDNPLDTGYNYIRCVKTTPISFDMGKNVRYNWVQVICNQGAGSSTLTGTAANSIDPNIQLAWSNDTGINFSNERAAPVGKIGEYQKRSRVLSCGMGRNRVWRIAMTDPVPFILVSLLINGQPCKF